MAWRLKYKVVIGSDGFMTVCFLLNMFLDKKRCAFNEYNKS